MPADQPAIPPAGSLPPPPAPPTVTALEAHFFPAPQPAPLASRRLMVVLHGLGDSMAGFYWMPRMLGLPWLNYLLVNAPQPYFTGYAWYDRDDPEPGVLPPKSGLILEAFLYRGELPRGEIAGIHGVGDREGRRAVAALADKGMIVSGTSRAPIRLAFPATLASRWMRGLFPDKAE